MGFYNSAPKYPISISQFIYTKCHKTETQRIENVILCYFYDANDLVIWYVTQTLNEKNVIAISTKLTIFIYGKTYMLLMKKMYNTKI